MGFTLLPIGSKREGCGIRKIFSGRDVESHAAKSKAIFCAERERSLTHFTKQLLAC